MGVDRQRGENGENVDQQIRHHRIVDTIEKLEDLIVDLRLVTHQKVSFALSNDSDQNAEDFRLQRRRQLRKNLEQFRQILRLFDDVVFVHIELVVDQLKTNDSIRFAFQTFDLPC